MVLPLEGPTLSKEKYREKKKEQPPCFAMGSSMTLHQSCKIRVSLEKEVKVWNIVV